MILVKSLEEMARVHSPRAIALGFFDGVHIGHQRIILDLVGESGLIGAESTCLTFDPHPLYVLNHPDRPRMLTSLDEKVAILESLGVEACVVIPFSREFSLLTPREFAGSVLREALSARVVAVGFNFTFGRGGSGTSTDLRRLGSEMGFEVRVHDPVTVNGETVSSTAIRGLVAKGEMALAATMLGRHYALSGDVVAGDGRGRRLGMPTANLKVPAERLLPLDGVYATVVDTVHGRYTAVTNVGVRPTYPSGNRTVEAHILDFSGDIYGTRLTVSFLERLRGERLFESGEELRRQVEADATAARMIASGGGAGDR